MDQQLINEECLENIIDNHFCRILLLRKNLQEGVKTFSTV
jgi:hypothetical protein